MQVLYSPPHHVTSSQVQVHRATGFTAQPLRRTNTAVHTHSTKAGSEAILHTVHIFKQNHAQASFSVSACKESDVPKWVDEFINEDL